MLIKLVWFVVVEIGWDDVVLFGFILGFIGFFKVIMYFYCDFLIIVDGYVWEVFWVILDDVFVGLLLFVFIFGFGGLVVFLLCFGVVVILLENVLFLNMIEII